MADVNEIQLSESFGAVESAALPGMYEQAKADLAQCVEVDECKAWADKAEAIRSYARQANDEDLMHAAMKIKSRAVERLGSLIGNLEKYRGGRPKLADGPQPVTPRQEARDLAGVSKDQAEQAEAVARFAASEPDRYERMVESSKPATITALAKEGRRKSDKPASDPPRGDIDRVAAILHATKRLQKPVPASEFERKKMLLYLAEISRWALALTKSLRGK